MFEPEATDANLENYYSAIQSFENVVSLISNSDMEPTQILFALYKCYEDLEEGISQKDIDSPYLVDLLQLKLYVSSLMKIMEHFISRSKASLTSKDSAPNMTNVTLETPRVKSLAEIAGLWEVKNLLKSLVILPQTQPQLFVNCKPCTSLLLFGPPGTGKTHLVHALASEANAALHSVSSSALLSSLVGQTEKNIQALFESIRHENNLCVVFVDEVDGFCRTRRDSEQDHTRRMKTELMCQLSKMEGTNNMFLICATNCPWDLDTAFLRRFHKQLYIPLPNGAERVELFCLFAKNTPLEKYSDHWTLLTERTEGFSGSDLYNLVQSALHVPITELQETTLWKCTEDGLYEPKLNWDDLDLENCVCCKLSELPHGSVKARPVDIADVFKCLDGMTSTVSIAEVKKFETFMAKSTGEPSCAKHFPFR